MIGALIGKIVTSSVSKGATVAGKAAGKATKKAASKAGGAVKKKIGSIASKAMGAAGLASLFGGGASEPTPEEQTSGTAQGQGDSTQTGEEESITPSSDPLISLNGLTESISNVIPIFDENIAPLKSEESKTAVIIRKDVPLENKLNNQGENVSVLKAGTYIETRVDQIANLFQITDALRSSIGILDVGLSDVAKRLGEIDNSIQEVIDENRKTKLKNDRRRDEEQTEGEEEKKPSKFREKLGEAGEFAKAGVLLQLANYSRALVAGTVLTAMSVFGDESEEGDVEEGDIIPETEQEGFTAIDAALGVGGATVAAVAAKKVMGKKAAEEATQAAAKVAATEGAEAAAKTGAKVAATEGAEAAAKTAGKELAEVASKEAIEKVVPAIAKKSIAKTMAKAIPGISWVVGGALAVYELSRGNYAGAALEAGGSIGGAATAIPAMVGVIANEVYRAVYGDWPLNHSANIVSERMVSIKDAVGDYVSSYFESNAEYPKDEEAIKSAIEKGIYDHDYIGNSEVDLSRLNELTDKEIKAIIAEDDIDKETKESLEVRLKEIESSPGVTETPVTEVGTPGVTETSAGTVASTPTAQTPSPTESAKPTSESKVERTSGNLHLSKLTPEQSKIYIERKKTLGDQYKQKILEENADKPKTAYVRRKISAAYQRADSETMSEILKGKLFKESIEELIAQGVITNYEGPVQTKTETAEASDTVAQGSDASPLEPVAEENNQVQTSGIPTTNVMSFEDSLKSEEQNKNYDFSKNPASLIESLTPEPLQDIFDTNKQISETKKEEEIRKRDELEFFNPEVKKERLKSGGVITDYNEIDEEYESKILASTPLIFPQSGATEDSTSNIVESKVNVDKINEIASSKVDEKVSQVIPIVMPDRKPKATAGSSFAAGSNFASMAQDSAPSYSTRDTFVDLGFQS